MNYFKTASKKTKDSFVFFIKKVRLKNEEFCLHGFACMTFLVYPSFGRFFGTVADREDRVLKNSFLSGVGNHFSMRSGRKRSGPFPFFHYTRPRPENRLKCRAEREVASRYSLKEGVFSKRSFPPFVGLSEQG